MNTSFVVRSLALSALALASLMLPACASPQMRAQDNPAIMQSLSAQDRALALNGQIRLGMGKQAVYIAFGRPDQTVHGVSKAGDVESWIYTTTQTAYVGGFYGGGWGPGYGWGPGWRRGWGGWGGGWAGAGWGRGYYWGSPGFYSPWVYYQVPHRRVVFAKDQVVGYEVVSY
jgi:hypothetical protein